MTSSRSIYDKFPTLSASCEPCDCARGWPDICHQIDRAARAGADDKRLRVIAIECYTGLLDDEVERELRNRLTSDLFLTTHDIFKSSAEIDQLIAPYLGGDDPIFGVYSPLDMVDFLDPTRKLALRERVAAACGTVVVYGAGASLCCDADALVYADMPRWEGQLRQRRNQVSNLGTDNRQTPASLQYKRSFFIDWRACDRLKQHTLNRWDFLLDTTCSGDPKLITGNALRRALDAASRRPFRVVPFFDPAPWGGQWLKERFDLDPAKSNYGWGFDCVPEENSLLLDCGSMRVEIPAMNLIYHCPRDVLGGEVYGRFGPEFPIRFDFLDTMSGGNLSLQVHPTTAYAREHFGLDYTQDESYYILDAADDATVYLGLKEGVDPAAMVDALRAAQNGGAPFPVDRFVAKWHASKHDHFLIPSGTVHCSGANTVVLEISATPYIFTFKLWDWERLGLDGLPRPINIKRGQAVIDWSRDDRWVSANLVDRGHPTDDGAEWDEEITGLHPLQFIETRRHWFTGPVPHDTQGTVNVLNLIEGQEAVVESPTHAFEPFFVHYAETFIVPAAVGPYTIRPSGASRVSRCGTIKAFIRSINRTQSTVQE